MATTRIIKETRIGGRELRQEIEFVSSPDSRDLARIYQAMLGLEVQLVELEPPRSGITLRPEVLAFATAMEHKLREHDEEKGESWKHCDTDDLALGLATEVRELGDSITACGPEATIARKCVDVANYAMFLFARNGGGATNGE